MTDFSERRWISPDGLSLRARDYAPGDGAARAPVIAIHGLTRNSADFETIAPAIAATGRRVLAVDVRGRGLSDRAADPMTYRPDVYAQDMLALMDQAGLGRAIFLGTSMGGLITMVLAGLRPRAIGGAIINDIGPEIAPQGLARIAAYSGQPADTPTWAAAADYARRINGVAFPHYGPDDWDAFARRLFREGSDGAPRLDYDPDIAAPLRLSQAAAAVAPSPDLWPLFRRLARGRPMLLIRGETSDLLSADIMARMRHAAPRMACVEVPGVGHAPMLDEPPALSAILDFLARAP